VVKCIKQDGRTIHHAGQLPTLRVEVVKDDAGKALDMLSRFSVYSDTAMSLVLDILR